MASRKASSGPKRARTTSRRAGSSSGPRVSKPAAWPICTSRQRSRHTST
ncbi:Uncharacterised protein [Flavonifractor plautii]|uniref:Uncharacterized protein n=1 Tax=Flavonifractor plautii TaxID=292800 RepID=A0A174U9R0_FLAPL|nr:Uncharacterised protein [Flavonifractor plautii]